MYILNAAVLPKHIGAHQTASEKMDGQPIWCVQAGWFYCMDLFKNKYISIRSAWHKTHTTLLYLPTTVSSSQYPGTSTKHTAAGMATSGWEVVIITYPSPGCQATQSRSYSHRSTTLSLCMQSHSHYSHFSYIYTHLIKLARISTHSGMIKVGTDIQHRCKEQISYNFIVVMM